MGLAPEKLQQLEASLTREQLLAANGALVRRNRQLEHGIMQEYVEIATKVIEGFSTTVMDAMNGNLEARENVEKFLDALRLAQGKPIKLPRVLETPQGPIVVEAEGKSNVLENEILQEGPDT